MSMQHLRSDFWNIFLIGEGLAFGISDSPLLVRSRPSEADEQEQVGASPSFPPAGEGLAGPSC